MAEAIDLNADSTTAGDQVWDGPVMLGADLAVTGTDITFGDMFFSDAVFHGGIGWW